MAKQGESSKAVIAAKRRKLRLISGWTWLAVKILLIVVAAWLVFTQVFLISQVRGMDMSPAVKDGDLAIVFRMQQMYNKNDVVAYETRDGRRFGRIIAKSGDTVDFDGNGALLLNGAVQSGDIFYPSYAYEGISYPLTVPEGTFFIMGDCRNNAADSRVYGPVPLEEVEGKVITILRRRGL